MWFITIQIIITKMKYSLLLNDQMFINTFDIVVNYLLNDVSHVYHSYFMKFYQIYNVFELFTCGL